MKPVPRHTTSPPASFIWQEKSYRETTPQPLQPPPLLLLLLLMRRLQAAQLINKAVQLHTELCVCLTVCMCVSMCVSMCMRGSSGVCLLKMLKISFYVSQKTFRSALSSSECKHQHESVEICAKVSFLCFFY